MGLVKSVAARSAGFLGLAVLLMAVSCSKSPTSPTPPPPPAPVSNPPTVACVEGIARATTSAEGVVINYDTPATSDGQGSVIVSCSPAAGQMFPIGTTEVSCTATDTLNRTATCAFNVTVSKLPTLSRTRYLAFGDSITAGEVTFPINTLIASQGSITKQVVVPAAAYPTVLLNTLRGRYAAQASLMEVFNYGMGGEKVINSRNRYLSALNATRPEVLLLMEGANDIPAGENGAASTAAAEISVWVAEAKSRGIRVFLATPTPGRPGGNRTINPLLLVDYANRMRRIAEQQGVTLVDIYNLMLPDVQRYIGVDGLHPNELGYSRLADLFFQAIQGSLEVR